MIAGACMNSVYRLERSPLSRSLLRNCFDALRVLGAARLSMLTWNSLSSSRDQCIRSADQKSIEAERVTGVLCRERAIDVAQMLRSGRKSTNGRERVESIRQAA